VPCRHPNDRLDLWFRHYIEGILNLFRQGASRTSRLKGVEKVGKEPLLKEFLIRGTVGRMGPTSSTEGMSRCFDVIPGSRSPHAPTFQKGHADSSARVPQSTPFLQTVRVKDFASLTIRVWSVEGERILLAPHTIQLLLY